MDLFLSVVPYYEPQDIYDRIDNKDQWVEMSSEQHAFLCGLIKDRRPKKILEIGTSAGGTTAVVLNCCNKLKLDAELYTIDLLRKCWHDEERETGFIVAIFLNQMVVSIHLRALREVSILNLLMILEMK